MTEFEFKTRIRDEYLHIKKVIESCKTLKQFINVQKWYSRVYKKWNYWILNVDTPWYASEFQTIKKLHNEMISIDSEIIDLFSIKRDFLVTIITKRNKFSNRERGRCSQEIDGGKR